MTDARTGEAPLAHASGDLLDALGGAILGSGDTRLDPERAADHLAVVERAATAHTASRDLLQQAVSAARGSGHSWAVIGDVLGLTRQAAQQRFGVAADRHPDPVSADERETRWLGPVTAFDEMPELELAGRRGWRTIGAGMLKHRMLRTPTQWEHRRVVWRRPAAAYEKDGWQVAVRAFPWLYLVRDLGTPAEPD